MSFTPKIREGVRKARGKSAPAPKEPVSGGDLRQVGVLEIGGGLPFRQGKTTSMNHAFISSNER
jgi:hypothetical protein